MPSPNELQVKISAINSTAPALKELARDLAKLGKQASGVNDEMGDSPKIIGDLSKAVNTATKTHKDLAQASQISESISQSLNKTLSKQKTITASLNAVESQRVKNTSELTKTKKKLAVAQNSEATALSRHNKVQESHQRAIVDSNRADDNKLKLQVARQQKMATLLDTVERQRSSRGRYRQLRQQRDTNAKIKQPTPQQATERTKLGTQTATAEREYQKIRQQTRMEALQIRQMPTGASGPSKSAVRAASSRHRRAQAETQSVQVEVQRLASGASGVEQRGTSLERQLSTADTAIASKRAHLLSLTSDLNSLSVRLDKDIRIAQSIRDNAQASYGSIQAKVGKMPAGGASISAKTTTPKKAPVSDVEQQLVKLIDDEIKSKPKGKVIKSYGETVVEAVKNFSQKDIDYKTSNVHSAKMTLQGDKGYDSKQITAAQATRARTALDSEVGQKLVQQLKDQHRPQALPPADISVDVKQPTPQPQSEPQRLDIDIEAPKALADSRDETQQQRSARLQLEKEINTAIASKLNDKAGATASFGKHLAHLVNQAVGSDADINKELTDRTFMEMSDPKKKGFSKQKSITSKQSDKALTYLKTAEGRNLINMMVDPEAEDRFAPLSSEERVNKANTRIESIRGEITEKQGTLGQIMPTVEQGIAAGVGNRDEKGHALLLSGVDKLQTEIGALYKDIDSIIERTNKIINKQLAEASKTTNDTRKSLWQQFKAKMNKAVSDNLAEQSRAQSEMLKQTAVPVEPKAEPIPDADNARQQIVTALDDAIGSKKKDVAISYGKMILQDIEATASTGVTPNLDDIAKSAFMVSDTGGELKTSEITGPQGQRALEVLEGSEGLIQDVVSTRRKQDELLKDGDQDSKELMELRLKRTQESLEFTRANKYLSTSLSKSNVFSVAERHAEEEIARLQKAIAGDTPQQPAALPEPQKPVATPTPAPQQPAEPTQQVEIEFDADVKEEVDNANVTQNAILDEIRNQTADAQNRLDKTQKNLATIRKQHDEGAPGLSGYITLAEKVEGETKAELAVLQQTLTDFEEADTRPSDAGKPVDTEDIKKPIEGIDNAQEKLVKNLDKVINSKRKRINESSQTFGESLYQLINQSDDINDEALRAAHITVGPGAGTISQQLVGGVGGMQGTGGNTVRLTAKQQERASGYLESAEGKALLDEALQQREAGEGYRTSSQKVIEQTEQDINDRMNELLTSTRTGKQVPRKFAMATSSDVVAYDELSDPEKDFLAQSATPDKLDELAKFRETQATGEIASEGEQIKDSLDNVNESIENRLQEIRKEVDGLRQKIDSGIKTDYSQPYITSSLDSDVKRTNDSFTGGVRDYSSYIDNEIEFAKKSKDGWAIDHYEKEGARLKDLGQDDDSHEVWKMYKEGHEKEKKENPVYAYAVKLREDQEKLHNIKERLNRDFNDQFDESDISVDDIPKLRNRPSEFSAFAKERINKHEASEIKYRKADIRSAFKESIPRNLDEIAESKQNLQQQENDEVKLVSLLKELMSLTDSDDEARQMQEAINGIVDNEEARNNRLQKEIGTLDYTQSEWAETLKHKVSKSDERLETLRRDDVPSDTARQPSLPEGTIQQKVGDDLVTLVRSNAVDQVNSVVAEHVTAFRAEGDDRRKELDTLLSSGNLLSSDKIDFKHAGFGAGKDTDAQFKDENKYVYASLGKKIRGIADPGDPSRYDDDSGILIDSVKALENGAKLRIASVKTIFSDLASKVATDKSPALAEAAKNVESFGEEYIALRSKLYKDTDTKEVTLGGQTLDRATFDAIDADVMSKVKGDLPEYHLEGQEAIDALQKGDMKYAELMVKDSLSLMDDSVVGIIKDSVAYLKQDAATGIDDRITKSLAQPVDDREHRDFGYGDGSIRLYRDKQRERAGKASQYDMRFASDAEHVTSDPETLDEILTSKKLKPGVPMGAEDTAIQPDGTIMPEGHVFTSLMSWYRDEAQGASGVILDAQGMIRDLEARVRAGVRGGDDGHDLSNIDFAKAFEGQSALDIMDNFIKDNVVKMKDKTDAVVEIAVPSDFDIDKYFKGAFVDDQVYMKEEHLAKGEPEYLDPDDARKKQTEQQMAEEQRLFEQNTQSMANETEARNQHIATNDRLQNSQMREMADNSQAIDMEAEQRKTNAAALEKERGFYQGLAARNKQDNSERSSRQARIQEKTGQTPRTPFDKMRLSAEFSEIEKLENKESDLHAQGDVLEQDITSAKESAEKLVDRAYYPVSEFEKLAHDDVLDFEENIRKELAIVAEEGKKIKAQAKELVQKYRDTREELAKVITQVEDRTRALAKQIGGEDIFKGEDVALARKQFDADTEGVKSSANWLGGYLESIDSLSGTIAPRILDSVVNAAKDRRANPLEKRKVKIGDVEHDLIRDIERERDDKQQPYDLRYWDDAEHVVNAFGSQEGMSPKQASQQIRKTGKLVPRHADVDYDAPDDAEGHNVFFAQMSQLRAGIEYYQGQQASSGYILDAVKLIEEGGAFVRNLVESGFDEEEIKDHPKLYGKEAVDELKNYFAKHKDERKEADYGIEIVVDEDVDINDFIKGYFDDGKVYVKPEHLVDPAQRAAAGIERGEKIKLLPQEMANLYAREVSDLEERVSGPAQLALPPGQPTAQELQVENIRKKQQAIETQNEQDRRTANQRRSSRADRELSGAIGQQIDDQIPAGPMLKSNVGIIQLKGFQPAISTLADAGESLPFETTRDMRIRSADQQIKVMEHSGDTEDIKSATKLGENYFQGLSDKVGDELENELKNAKLKISIDVDGNIDVSMIVGDRTFKERLPNRAAVDQASDTKQQMAEEQRLFNENQQQTRDQERERSGMADSNIRINTSQMYAAGGTDMEYVPGTSDADKQPQSTEISETQTNDRQQALVPLLGDEQSLTSDASKKKLANANTVMSETSGQLNRAASAYDILTTSLDDISDQMQRDPAYWMGKADTAALGIDLSPEDKDKASVLSGTREQQVDAVLNLIRKIKPVIDQIGEMSRASSDVAVGSEFLRTTDQYGDDELVDETRDQFVGRVVDRLIISLNKFSDAAGNIQELPTADIDKAIRLIQAIRPQDLEGMSGDDINALKSFDMRDVIGQAAERMIESSTGAQAAITSDVDVADQERQRRTAEIQDADSRRAADRRSVSRSDRELSGAIGDQVGADDLARRQSQYQREGEIARDRISKFVPVDDYQPKRPVAQHMASVMGDAKDREKSFQRMVAMGNVFSQQMLKSLGLSIDSSSAMFDNDKIAKDDQRVFASASEKMDFDDDSFGFIFDIKKLLSMGATVGDDMALMYSDAMTDLSKKHMPEVDGVLSSDVLSYYTKLTDPEGFKQQYPEQDADDLYLKDVPKDRFMAFYKELETTMNQISNVFRYTGEEADAMLSVGGLDEITMPDKLPLTDALMGFVKGGQVFVSPEENQRIQEEQRDLQLDENERIKQGNSENEAQRRNRHNSDKALSAAIANQVDTANDQAKRDSQSQTELDAVRGKPVTSAAQADTSAEAAREIDAHKQQQADETQRQLNAERETTRAKEREADAAKRNALAEERANAAMTATSRSRSSTGPPPVPPIPPTPPSGGTPPGGDDDDDEKTPRQKLDDDINEGQRRLEEIRQRHRDQYVDLDAIAERSDAQMTAATRSATSGAGDMAQLRQDAIAPGGIEQSMALEAFENEMQMRDQRTADIENYQNLELDAVRGKPVTAAAQADTSAEAAREIDAHKQQQADETQRQLEAERETTRAKQREADAAKRNALAEERADAAMTATSRSRSSTGPPPVPPIPPTPPSGGTPPGGDDDDEKTPRQELDDDIRAAERRLKDIRQNQRDEYRGLPAIAARSDDQMTAATRSAMSDAGEMAQLRQSATEPGGIERSMALEAFENEMQMRDARAAGAETYERHQRSADDATAAADEKLQNQLIEQARAAGRETYERHQETMNQAAARAGNELTENIVSRGRRTQDDPTAGLASQDEVDTVISDLKSRLKQTREEQSPGYGGILAYERDRDSAAAATAAADEKLQNQLIEQARVSGGEAYERDQESANTAINDAKLKLHKQILQQARDEESSEYNRDSASANNAIINAKRNLAKQLEADAERARKQESDFYKGLSQRDRDKGAPRRQRIEELKGERQERVDAFEKEKGFYKGLAEDKPKSTRVLRIEQLREEYDAKKQRETEAEQRRADELASKKRRPLDTRTSHKMQRNVDKDEQSEVESRVRGLLTGLDYDDQEDKLQSEIKRIAGDMLALKDGKSVFDETQKAKEEYLSLESAEIDRLLQEETSPEHIDKLKQLASRNKSQYIDLQRSSKTFQDMQFEKAVMLQEDAATIDKVRDENRKAIRKTQPKTQTNVDASQDFAPVLSLANPYYIDSSQDVNAGVPGRGAGAGGGIDMIDIPPPPKVEKAVADAVEEAKKVLKQADETPVSGKSVFDFGSLMFSIDKTLQRASQLQDATSDGARIVQKLQQGDLPDGGFKRVEGQGISESGVHQEIDDGVITNALKDQEAAQQKVDGIRDQMETVYRNMGQLKRVDPNIDLSGDEAVLSTLKKQLSAASKEQADLLESTKEMFRLTDEQKSLAETLQKTLAADDAILAVEDALSQNSEGRQALIAQGDEVKKTLNQYLELGSTIADDLDGARDTLKTLRAQHKDSETLNAQAIRSAVGVQKKRQTAVAAVDKKIKTQEDKIGKEGVTQTLSTQAIEAYQTEIQRLYNERKQFEPAIESALQDLKAAQESKPRKPDQTAVGTAVDKVGRARENMEAAVADQDSLEQALRGEFIERNQAAVDAQFAAIPDQLRRTEADSNVVKIQERLAEETTDLAQLRGRKGSYEGELQRDVVKRNRYKVEQLDPIGEQLAAATADIAKQQTAVSTGKRGEGFLNSYLEATKAYVDHVKIQNVLEEKSAAADKRVADAFDALSKRQETQRQRQTTQTAAGDKLKTSRGRVTELDELKTQLSTTADDISTRLVDTRKSTTAATKDATAAEKELNKQKQIGIGLEGDIQNAQQRHSQNEDTLQKEIKNLTHLNNLNQKRQENFEGVVRPEPIKNAQGNFILDAQGNRKTRNVSGKFTNRRLGTAERELGELLNKEASLGDPDAIKKEQEDINALHSAATTERDKSIGDVKKKSTEIDEKKKLHESYGKQLTDNRTIIDTLSDGASELSDREEEMGKMLTGMRGQLEEAKKIKSTDKEYLKVLESNVGAIETMLGQRGSADITGEERNQKLDEFRQSIAAFAAMTAGPDADKDFSEELKDIQSKIESNKEELKSMDTAGIDHKETLGSLTKQRGELADKEKELMTQIEAAEKGGNEQHANRLKASITAEESKQKNLKGFVDKMKSVSQDLDDYLGMQGMLGDDADLKASADDHIKGVLQGAGVKASDIDFDQMGRHESAESYMSFIQDQLDESEKASGRFQERLDASGAVDEEAVGKLRGELETAQAEGGGIDEEIKTLKADQPKGQESRKKDLNAAIKGLEKEAKAIDAHIKSANKRKTLATEYLDKLNTTIDGIAASGGEVPLSLAGQRDDMEKKIVASQDIIDEFMRPGLSEEMGQELDVLRNELTELQGTQEEKETAVADAIKSVQDIRDRKSELDTTKKARIGKQSEIKELKDKLKPKEDAAAETQAAVDAQLAKVNALQEEANALRAEHINLTNEHADSVQMTSDKQEEYNKLVGAQSVADEQQTGLESELSDTKKSLEDVNASLVEAKKNVTAVRSEFTAANTELKKANTQVTNAANQHTSALEKQVDAQKTLADKRRELSVIEDAVLQSEGELRPEEKKLAEKIKAKEELEKEYQKLADAGPQEDKAKTADLKLGIQSYDAQISTQVSLIGQAKEGLDNLQKKQKEVYAETQASEDLVAKTQAERETVLNQLTEAQDRVTVSTQAHAEAVENLDEKEQQLVKRQEEHASSKADVAVKEETVQQASSKTAGIDSRIKELESDKKKAQTKQKGTSSKVADAERELTRLSTERADAQQELENATKLVTSAQDDQTDSAQRLADAERQVSDLETSEAAIVQGLKQARVEQADIESQLTANDKDKIKIQDELNKGLERQGEVADELAESMKRMNDKSQMSHALVETAEVMESALESVKHRFMELGRGVIDAAGEMEDFRYALAAVEGSAAAAEVRLKQLVEVSKKPGIKLPGAVRASVVMRALGLETEQGTKTIEEFANTIALIGGGEKELNRAFLGFQQIISKGRVLAEEINQMREVTGLFAIALERVYNTQDAEAISKVVGLGRQNVIEGFAKPLVEELSKLKRAGLEGFRNNVTNIETAVFRLKAALGDALLPQINTLLQLGTKAAEMLIEMNKQFNGLGSNTLVATAGITLIATLFTKWIFFSREFINKVNDAGFAMVNFAKNVDTTKGVMNSTSLATDTLGKKVSFLRGTTMKLTDSVGHLFAFMTAGKFIAISVGIIAAATAMIALYSFLSKAISSQNKFNKSIIKYNKLIKETGSYEGLRTVVSHRLIELQEIIRLNNEIIKQEKIKKQIDDPDTTKEERKELVEGYTGTPTLSQDAISAGQGLQDSIALTNMSDRHGAVKQLEKTMAWTAFLLQGIWQVPKHAVFNIWSGAGKVIEKSLGDAPEHHAYRAQKELDKLETTDALKILDPEVARKTYQDAINKLTTERGLLEKDIQSYEAAIAYANSEDFTNAWRARIANVSTGDLGMTKDNYVSYRRDIEVAKQRTSMNDLVAKNKDVTVELEKHQGLLKTNEQWLKRNERVIDSTKRQLAEQTVLLDMLDRTYEKMSHSIQGLVNSETKMLSVIEKKFKLESKEARETKKTSEETIRFKREEIDNKLDTGGLIYDMGELQEDGSRVAKTRYERLAKMFNVGVNEEFKITDYSRQHLTPEDIAAIRTPFITEPLQFQTDYGIAQAAFGATLTDEQKKIRDALLEIYEIFSQVQQDKLDLANNKIQTSNELYQSAFENRIELTKTMLSTELELHKAHSDRMIRVLEARNDMTINEYDEIMERVKGNVQDIFDNPDGRTLNTGINTLVSSQDILNKAHEKRSITEHALLKAQEKANRYQLDEAKAAIEESYLDIGKDLGTGLFSYLAEQGANFEVDVKGNVTIDKDQPNMLAAKQASDVYNQINAMFSEGFLHHSMAVSGDESGIDKLLTTVLQSEQMSKYLKMFADEGKSSEVRSQLIEAISAYEIALQGLDTPEEIKLKRQELQDTLNDSKQEYQKFLKDMLNDARNKEVKAVVDNINLQREVLDYTTRRSINELKDTLKDIESGKSRGSYAEIAKRIRDDFKILENNIREKYGGKGGIFQGIIDNTSQWSKERILQLRKAAQEMRKDLDSLRDELESALERGEPRESALTEYHERYVDFWKRFGDSITDGQKEALEDIQADAKEFRIDEIFGADITKDPSFDPFSENWKGMFDGLESAHKEYNSLQERILENRRSNLEFDRSLEGQVLGAFHIKDANQHLNQQVALYQQILALKTAAIDREKLPTGYYAAAAEMVNRNVQKAGLVFDTENSIKDLQKNIHDEVGSDFGYLETAFENLGSTLWERFWTQPHDTEDKLEEIQADMQFRIDEINNDMTLSVRKREQKIASIERESSKKRAKIERDLADERSQIFKDYAFGVVKDIAMIVYEEKKADLAKYISRQVSEGLPGLSTIGNLLGIGVGATAEAGAGAGASALTTGLATVGGLSPLAIAGIGAGAIAIPALLAYLFRDDIGNFFDEIGFDNPSHDAMARKLGMDHGRKVAYGKSATELGKSSRKDILSNFENGFENGAGMSRNSTRTSETQVIQAKNKQINKLEGMVNKLISQPIEIENEVNMHVDDRVIKGYERRKSVLRRNNVIPKE